MTQPGPTLLRGDNTPRPGPKLAIGMPLIVVETERGPDSVVDLRSMSDYATKCGARTLDSQAGYDWLDSYFANGGGAVKLVSLRGAAAAKASCQLRDASNVVAATVTWNAFGADGNNGSIDIDAGVTTGTFIAKLLYKNAVIATSPELADNVALQAWAAAAPALGKVTIAPGAGADCAPTASPVALAGGNDDFAGITTTQIASGLAKFAPVTLPGHYVLPGRTSLGSHTAVADALVAARVNRMAVLAMPDLSAAQVVAQAAQLRDHAASDMIDLLAGRIRIPGLALGTYRTVTLDQLRAARQAYNDAQKVTPNQPAAGDYGEAQYGYELVHQGVLDDWTDAEVELLYDAGVNVALVRDGRIRLYGSRVLADPGKSPAGFRLGSARLRMALCELLRFRCETVSFHELDPMSLRDLESKITGDVRRYPTSVQNFRVVTEIRPGDVDGTAVLYAAILDLEANYDAERTLGEYSRSVTTINTEA